MNSELRKCKSVRKYRDNKLVRTVGKRSHLGSETNYDTRKVISKSLLAVEMKRTHIAMNERVYLDLPIL